ncbi:MAG: hypothetical protein QGG64_12215, partial [Candidatus Latescibacteria bacterium]|nr:hypothetical protein [Candidatus Latescibacterota bacterium]
SYRLQTQCTSCPNFEFCYREALQREDIHFVPHVTAGALQKFRKLNLDTIASAHKWFEAPEDDFFSPHQKMQLSGRLTALQTNKIGLVEQKTRLYPTNLSTAIFLHIVEDPLSGHPRALGWRILRAGAIVEGKNWVVA